MAHSITVSTGKTISLEGLTSRKPLSELLTDTKITERLDKVLIVLLDRSGSMFDSMDSGTKISVAWKVLQNELMPNMIGWAYGLLTFGGWNQVDWKIYPCTDANALTVVREPSPDGGTPMRHALDVAWDWSKEHCKAARFILLSDGCPTDSTTTQILWLAENHKSIPIDTVGIGYKSFEYDPEFLRQLSAITGGIFTEVGTVKELANTILKLSPSNRPLLGTVKNV